MKIQFLLDSIKALPVTQKEKITQKFLENAGLKDITLRAHQLYGVSWLKGCVSQNRGGILCDEMGLGKTCQIIAFLTSVFKESPQTTALIVTPLSVIQNWKSELERFSPKLKFTLYIGDQFTRTEIRDAFSLRDTPVVLTSFEVALNDEEFFNKHHWKILVVDEGHRLKNSESMLYGALSDTCHSLRFILSGTPVQNNLVELYNLLHFVAPKYFPLNTRSTFVNYFDSSTDAPDDLKDMMSQILRPFLLRRTKRQVLPDLPPRVDLLLYHPLSRIQTEIYRALLTRNADVLSAVISSNTKSTAPCYRLQNMIMQLRKCVDHPYLFDGVEPEPFQLGQHLIDASGKLVLLDALLSHLFNPWNDKQNVNEVNPKIRPPVHKVLVFSQMTRMLDIIQDYLTLKDYAYERLDGSIRGEDRYSAIKGFSEEDGVFIFLLSTKAGGQGLNLIAADTVILVDSDFNPQNDLQATARAHRIGQTKPVRIIRLVGRNTVEEAILSRADAKLKLTAQVLGSADTALSAEDKKSASTEELVNVIKFGLSRLLEELHIGQDTDNNTDHTSSTPVTDSQRRLRMLNFAQILGETDPNNGHWLEPPDTTGATSGEQTDFVVLTDKPFECEASEADQEVVLQLKAESTVTNQGISQKRDDQSLPAITRKPLTAEELAERAKKRAEVQEARKLKAKETQARRAAAKLEKRKAKWDSVGYRTLSVYRDDEPDDEVEPVDDEIEEDGLEDDEISEGNSPSTHQPGIYYKSGDASEPLTKFGDVDKVETEHSPAFVCISVDDSGGWGTRGFFDAVNRRCKALSEAYERAGEMDDLALGDCHLVPVIDPFLPNAEQVDIETFGDWLLSKNNSSNARIRANFGAVLVAQHHSRRSQSQGQPPDLQLEALDTALSALGKACRSVKQCSVHLPRLGHGTHAFTWYSVERLLRKHLVERSRVPVYVYYYRRTNGHASTSTRATAANQSHKRSRLVQPEETEPESSPEKRKRSAEDQPDEQTSIGPRSRHLINLFSGKRFYVSRSPPGTGSSPTSAENEPGQAWTDEVARLKRLIVAYDGDWCDQMDSSVTHVVCVGRGEASTVLQPSSTQYKLITPAWIDASIKKRLCQPESDYCA